MAGGLLTAVIAALHAAAVTITQGAARGFAFALRAVDTALLFARGMRGIRCPWCYEEEQVPGLPAHLPPTAQ